MQTTSLSNLEGEYRWSFSDVSPSTTEFELPSVAISGLTMHMTITQNAARWQERGQRVQPSYWLSVLSMTNRSHLNYSIQITITFTDRIDRSRDLVKTCHPFRSTSSVQYRQEIAKSSSVYRLFQHSTLNVELLIKLCPMPGEQHDASTESGGRNKNVAVNKHDPSSSSSVSNSRDSRAGRTSKQGENTLNSDSNLNSKQSSEQRDVEPKLPAGEFFCLSRVKQEREDDDPVHKDTVQQSSSTAVDESGAQANADESRKKRKCESKDVADSIQKKSKMMLVCKREAIDGDPNEESNHNPEQTTAVLAASDNSADNPDTNNHSMADSFDSIFASALKVFEELKCDQCSSVMQPPINSCSNGHSFCEKCKLPTDRKCCPKCEQEKHRVMRNHSLERIAALAYYPCTNANCHERYLLSEKEEHFKNCSHREVACGLKKCDWAGEVRLLHEHTLADHKRLRRVLSSEGTVKIDTNPDNVSKKSYFVLYDSQVFMLKVTKVEPQQYYVCVKLIGVLSEAKNYRFTIKLQSQNPSIDYKCQFESTVHSDQEKKNGQCIGLATENVLRTNGCINANGHLTIGYSILLQPDS